MKFVLIGLIIIFIILFTASKCQAALPTVESIEGWVMDKIELNYPTPYVIQKGDSMYRIAKRFGIEVGALIEANPHIENPHLIYVNQTLLIPLTYRPPAPSRTIITRVQSYEEFVANVTAYAPLDPNAVEGMCYSGDPTVTASGAPSTPMRSIAMDKRFPFGTRVEIFGYKPFEGIVFVVEDRFGRGDHGNKLDVMFATKKEALKFGRRNLTVRVYR